MERFKREDILSEKIYIPLKVRRMSYNKYSFMLSGVLKETISFLNPEAWFFQEINPTGNKAMIMFFWPDLILAVIGIYFIRNNRKVFLFLLKLLALAWGYFLIFKLAENFRYLLVVPLMSILIAIALNDINSRFYKVLFLLLIVYGYQGSVYDLLLRPDYWLDNRPIVYKYIFDRTRNMAGPFLITDRVADARKYCRYYLKDKCSKDYSFNSFDLKEVKPDKGRVYAGFVGEFIGYNFQNNFSSDSVKIIDRDKNIEIFFSQKVRDSVAFGYGDIILIGRSD